MADRALAAARAMGNELLELGHDASLAGGSAGIAVLYAYLDRISRGRDFDMLAGCYLARAQAGAARPPLSPSLYRGAIGVAWAAAHLQKPGPLTGAVEQTLAGFLNGSVPPGDYGLTDGLVGFGVYARERLGEPEAAAMLEQVVDRLAESALRRPDGLTWRTAPDRLPRPLRSLAPDGCCDLGLARGLPGVVALLAAAVQAGVNAGKARSLLTGAVEWLLALRLQGSSTSCFPPGPGQRRPAGLPGPAGATATRALRQRCCWQLGPRANPSGNERRWP
jgi:hypothetical protein